MIDKLPDYIDCNDNTEVCDYYITHLCKNKCPYALSINGIGIGAMDGQTARKVIDNLFKEDMRDY